MSIISTLIWCVVSYFIAKEYEKEYVFGVKAFNYVLLTFFFGFILSMSILMVKVGDYRNKEGLKILGYIGVAIGILLNFLVLFI